MLKRGKKLRFKAGIEFKCPFCGLSVKASADDAAILHLMPMCEKFNRLDPVAFMRAVNEENAKRQWN